MRWMKAVADTSSHSPQNHVGKSGAGKKGRNTSKNQGRNRANLGGGSTSGNGSSGTRHIVVFNPQIWKEETLSVIEDWAYCFSSLWWGLKRSTAIYTHSADCNQTNIIYTYTGSCYTWDRILYPVSTGSISQGPRLLWSYIDIDLPIWKLRTIKEVWGWGTIDEITAFVFNKNKFRHNQNGRFLHPRLCMKVNLYAGGIR